jgi:hypothetical protein
MCYSLFHWAASCWASFADDIVSSNLATVDRPIDPSNRVLVAVKLRGRGPLMENHEGTAHERTADLLVG